MPRFLLYVLVALVGVSGCARDTMTEVHGTVLLDRSPLEDGIVIFTAQKGTPPVVLNITRGSYRGKVQIGLNRVQFCAFRVDKSIVPPDKYTPLENRVNILPDRYKTRSPITVTVDQPAPNPFDFSLESK